MKSFGYSFRQKPFARIAMLICVVCVCYVFVKIAVTAQKFMIATKLTPRLIMSILSGDGSTLRHTENRVNVLILGIGGESHTSGDLTDTMLVVSVSLSPPTVSLISLPRDIWSDTLKDKINSAYHYGEEKKAGGGMTLAKVITEEVTGLTMHYVWLVDFQGFVDVIQHLGGISVDVAEGFTDTNYPIKGKETDECEGDLEYRCRYTEITFNSGLQQMDGERALMYVRSRHAEGDQGTDFARARRQQEVYMALMKSIRNVSVWFPPERGVALLQLFNTLTESSMTPGEVALLGRIVASVPQHTYKRITIESELLEAPEWKYGRYALEPAKNYASLHDYINEQLQK